MIENKIETNTNDENLNQTSSIGESATTHREINVQCKNVFRIFHQGELEVVALKGVNLNIYAGEIVVIMGPSGSGKTTLLNVISGMDQASAGTVLVRGYNLTKMKDQGVQQLLQDEIGIVFQFFNLIPSLTAEGNIELPMIIAKKSDDYKRTRIKELIETIGLEDRSHHRPFSLSGGQKQRVAIAMAFANDPTIILADEPTGNIDSVSSEKIMEIFKEYIKQNPEKSIVIVTHNPEMRKIADRTLVIKDGQIVRELGRLEDLNPEENPLIDENSEDVDKILKLNEGIDQIKSIMNSNERQINYEDLHNCPMCNSDNIVKKYNRENGPFKIINNQLLTRCSIFCHKCYQIHEKWVNLFDVVKDM